MNNICSDWFEINDFQSLIEFKRFVVWIEQQLNSDFVEEIEAKEFYLSPNNEERWFYCSTNNEIWRLVYPDGPFHGYWGKVT